MSKAVKLFVITLMIYCVSSGVQAQSATIHLELLNVGTLDFAAFAFEKNLENQQRIMHVTIIPEGDTVFVEGKILWKKDWQEDFIEIGSYKTLPFKARAFYNDEIGNSEIDLESSDYNSDLMKENIERGKPSGNYGFVVILYNLNGTELSRAYGELPFLNPTSPTIQLPIEGSTYDVGSIMVQWAPSIGAESYRIVANYIAAGQAKEEALNSANPLVNNRDVGNITTVNLRDVLDRELLANKEIVLAVKAVVTGTGGEVLLSSPIITFRTTSESSFNDADTEVDPTLIQLADFLKGYVDRSLIDKILSGEINAGEIQITDENNNSVQLSDLQSILNYLKANRQSIISINFTAM